MEKTKASISIEEIEHLAWLARLELTEDEKKLYVKQLNKVLEYFSILSELNTEKTPPTYHLVGKVNVFREDEPKPPLNVNEVLMNTSRKKELFFECAKIV
ncbi:MAG: Asp-tRNA(Asn)/Glu-tRNA(Gln) amidotransferase subunit GatC [Candidatus Bathyarchaeota archaeon]